MMQKLIFESAWDKTIAPRDRKTIEQLFESTKLNDTNTIETITINQAFNHKEDLLVIVLIHNFSDETFQFENLHAIYKAAELEIAAADFSFPKLALEAKTSMPWTFIFPKNTQVAQAQLEHGTLNIK